MSEYYGHPDDPRYHGPECETIRADNENIPIYDSLAWHMAFERRTQTGCGVGKWDAELAAINAEMRDAE